jgi:hypothetical protein
LDGSDYDHNGEVAASVMNYKYGIPMMAVTFVETYHQQPLQRLW